MSSYHEMREAIEKSILKVNAERKAGIILYPFGDQGLQMQRILHEAYGVKETYIIDSYLASFNKKIKPLTFLKSIDCSKYVFLITSDVEAIHEELREGIEAYVKKENIFDVYDEKGNKTFVNEKTKCGKYSYGPLCSHELVLSVGAFSSFALGTDVVRNHSVQYISTHPFIYGDREANDVFPPYDEYRGKALYFEGVHPHGKSKNKRITIGNDVWLGQNVIITNGSDIGNGVIAGAGSIITKAVPDYAVVVGAPARIIRYRYTPAQIEALNRIAWWDWSDEKIRKYHEDFYGDVDAFIEKHGKLYEK